MTNSSEKSIKPAPSGETRGTPTLEELLESARKHVMTPEEVDAQRKSWVRGEMGISAAERTEGRHITMMKPLAPEATTKEPDYERVKSDSEKLAIAKRVLLQHLNDEDYEMSLAGLFAELTADDVAPGEATTWSNKLGDCANPPEATTKRPEVKQWDTLPGLPKAELENLAKCGAPGEAVGRPEHDHHKWKTIKHKSEAVGRETREPDDCYHCQGKGRVLDKGGFVTCPVCSGRGEVAHVEHDDEKIARLESELSTLRRERDQLLLAGGNLVVACKMSSSAEFAASLASFVRVLEEINAR